MNEMV